MVDTLGAVALHTVQRVVDARVVELVARWYLVIVARVVLCAELLQLVS